MYSGRERALCWKQVHLGAPQCKATGGKREDSRQQTLSFQGWEELEAVEDGEEMRNKQVLDIKEQGVSSGRKQGRQVMQTGQITSRPKQAQPWKGHWEQQGVDPCHGRQRNTPHVGMAVAEKSRSLAGKVRKGTKVGLEGTKEGNF